MSDEQQEQPGQPKFEGNVTSFVFYLDPTTHATIRKSLDYARGKIEEAFNGVEIPGMEEAIEKLEVDARRRLLFVGDDGPETFHFPPPDQLTRAKMWQALRNMGMSAYQAGWADSLPDEPPAVPGYMEEIVPFDSESFAAAAERTRQAALAHFTQPPKPDEKTQARARSREDIGKKRRQLYGRKGKPK